MSERRGYSDKMAQRIRCLQIGSFECILRGDVYSEEECQAVLPYLDVAFDPGGYCIAAFSAAYLPSDLSWLHEDDPDPCEVAARYLRVVVKSHGFVHQRDDDSVVLLWSAPRADGIAALHDLLEAAADRLRDRHDIEVHYSIGTWQTALTEARVSLAQAIARWQGEPTTPESTSVDEAFGCPSVEMLSLSNQEPVRSIQQYVMDHFRDPELALRTIAVHFGLTETYVSQIFKEYAGLNYSVFLEHARIEEARRLLEAGELGVAEIATSVGYTINSTFYRAFRRLHGVSPSRYRLQSQHRPASIASGQHQMAM